MKHRPALERKMEAALVTQRSEHCVKVLDAAGVPCGPVYTYAQLFADPQLVHREMVVHADDAELGRVPRIRTPIRMPAASVTVRAVAPGSGSTPTRRWARSTTLPRTSKASGATASSESRPGRACARRGEYTGCYSSPCRRRCDSSGASGYSRRLSGRDGKKGLTESQRFVIRG
jgi:hypothetical protein